MGLFVITYGFPFFQKKISDSGFHNVLLIDIQPSELVSFLTGRLPVNHYQTISLMENPTKGRHLIALKDGLWGIVEKIYLDAHANEFEIVEMFSWGDMIYRTTLHGTRTAGEFIIPSKLVINNGQGVSIDLHIEEFWPNVQIAPSLFILNIGSED
jgi:uncharacterized protein YkvS